MSLHGFGFYLPSRRFYRASSEDGPTARGKYFTLNAIKAPTPSQADVSAVAALQEAHDEPASQKSRWTENSPPRPCKPLSSRTASSSYPTEGIRSPDGRRSPPMRGLTRLISMSSIAAKLRRSRISWMRSSSSTSASPRYALGLTLEQELAAMGEAAGSETGSANRTDDDRQRSVAGQYVEAARPGSRPSELPSEMTVMPRTTCPGSEVHFAHAPWKTDSSAETIVRRQPNTAGPYGWMSPFASAECDPEADVANPAGSDTSSGDLADIKPHAPPSSPVGVVRRRARRVPRFKFRKWMRKVYAKVVPAATTSTAMFEAAAHVKPVHKKVLRPSKPEAKKLGKSKQKHKTSKRMKKVNSIGGSFTLRGRQPNDHHTEDGGLDRHPLRQVFKGGP